MKKVVAAVLACSMLIVFTGCKNQNGTCRWNPFSRTNTVCYTPSCEIPVVDDCCPTPCGVPVSSCDSCAVGGAPVQSSTSIPVIEPAPVNWFSSVFDTKAVLFRKPICARRELFVLACVGVCWTFAKIFSANVFKLLSDKMPSQTVFEREKRNVSGFWRGRRNRAFEISSPFVGHSGKLSKRGSVVFPEFEFRDVSQV